MSNLCPISAARQKVFQVPQIFIGKQVTIKLGRIIIHREHFPACKNVHNVIYGAAHHDVDKIRILDGNCSRIKGDIHRVNKKLFCYGRYINEREKVDIYLSTGIGFAEHVDKFGVPDYANVTTADVTFTILNCPEYFYFGLIGEGDMAHSPETGLDNVLSYTELEAIRLLNISESRVVELDTKGRIDIVMVKPEEIKLHQDDFEGDVMTAPVKATEPKVKDTPTIPVTELQKVVAAKIVSNGKILVLFHNKLQMLSIPVGKVDKGETTEDALLREMYEELGITQFFVKGCHVAYNRKLNIVQYVYHIEINEEPVNKESEKHAFLEFWKPSKIHESIHPKTDVLLASIDLF